MVKLLARRKNETFHTTRTHIDTKELGVFLCCSLLSFRTFQRCFCCFCVLVCCCCCCFFNSVIAFTPLLLLMGYFLLLVFFPSSISLCFIFHEYLLCLFLLENSYTIHITRRDIVHTYGNVQSLHFFI